MGIAKKLYLGTGLFLPTSGGTATQLDYYEELQHQTTFGCNGQVTGSLNVYLIRIGKMVNISIPVISFTNGVG
jgi:hypothetical protein